MHINNYLINFKTKNDYKLGERAQIFAYALHKYMRDRKYYEKVYFLNPRFHVFEELVSQSLMMQVNIKIVSI